MRFGSIFIVLYPLCCLIDKVKLEAVRQRSVQRSVKKVQNRQSREISLLSPIVRIQLLGPFQMFVGNQKVTLSARKAKALMAYLAVRLNEEVPRDTLVGLLWSDRGPDQARASLRQSLSSIRSALGSAAEKALFSTNDFVKLTSDAVSVDRRVIIVLPANAPIDGFGDLATQFHGVFLEGINVDEPEFDYWLSAERAAVQTDKISFLTELVDRCQRDTRIDDALRYGTQLLTLDPLHEQMHRTLMRLFAGQGRHDAALKQFELCKHKLLEQLQTQPDQATLDLVAEIKAQRRARVSAPTQNDKRPQSTPATDNFNDVIGLDFSIPDYPSIAVMPFSVANGELDQEVFAEGISDDITTALSKIDRLLVVDHRSTLTYKGQAPDVGTIGAEQGVRYVLEGKVRRATGRVRVVATLIDTQSNQTIWADKFDRDLADVFKVQDELTKEIVTAMDVKLRTGEQHHIWSSGTDNIEAWESVRLATDAILGGSKETEQRARELIEHALKLDPNYANAWAMQARLYFNEADVGGGIKSAEHFERSQAAAFEGAYRALEIDPGCAEAFAVLALIHLNADQHDLAVAMTEKAIELAPNSAEILGGVASAVMRKSGFPERGAKYVRRAMRLCPCYRPGLLRALGHNYRLSGRLEEAVLCYRESIRREAGYLAAHVNLASALGELGWLTEAKETAAEIISREPRFSIEEYAGGLSYRRPSDLKRIVDGLHGAGLPEGPPENALQSSPAKPSVAVLPFANLSGDLSQDYFSDGITSDIITELSRFKTLFIVAQHSSFAFKGQRIGIQEIAEKLGVQYVVEGSVRRAGSAIRISVQLIEAETGHHVWAERYDRELNDIFAVQDELTRSIVGVLPGRVQGDVADRAARMPTTNMKAYELMLQGKQMRDGLDAESTAKARLLMEKALALDPNYARAYMYLADTYVVDLWLGLADEGASQKSLQLSRKGAGLDNNDVYIQDQLGFAFLCEGLWDDAELQFTRTLARIVNEAESMAWCGYGFLLLGHEAKALEVVTEAMRLDPLHAPAVNWILGQVQFFSGDYTGAIRALIGEALLNSLAHAFLASSYAHLGKIEEAQNALAKFVQVRQAELASRGRGLGDETIASLVAAYKPMWRKDSSLEHLVDGLHKAGLPYQ
ncbi:MAG: adenylate cyclase [Paracoccaceae bacterium]|jgi:adenylate cyclase